jgi:hypothetical protein
LVYAQYLPFGYANERENQMRISPWNLTGRSHTLIAERAGRVVGTLTCLEDGGEGLPADETYPERVRTLRAQRGKLLEVSALAISNDEAETTVVMELIRYLTTYSRQILRGSDWVITVNPRHVRFYEKAMLFERQGAENECRSANGAPGVLLRLDLETMPERYAQKYGKRSGARNLHDIFFEPTAAARRFAELQAAAERRRLRWEVTRQALALLQN